MFLNKIISGKGEEVNFMQSPPCSRDGTGKSEGGGAASWEEICTHKFTTNCFLTVDCAMAEESAFSMKGGVCLSNLSPPHENI